MAWKQARWLPLFITFLTSPCTVMTPYQVSSEIYDRFFYSGITIKGYFKEISSTVASNRPTEALASVISLACCCLSYLIPRKRTQPWTDCLSHKLFIDIASVKIFFWLRPWFPRIFVTLIVLICAIFWMIICLARWFTTHFQAIIRSSQKVTVIFRTIICSSWKFDLLFINRPRAFFLKQFADWNNYINDLSNYWTRKKPSICWNSITARQNVLPNRFIFQNQVLGQF